MKLGTIRVSTTPDKVTADSTVDLTVRYVASSKLADKDATPASYGKIQVTLPAGWGPDNSAMIETNETNRGFEDYHLSELHKVEHRDTPIDVAVIC